MQLMRQPKALMIAAAIILGMGLIPGFPIAPFSLIAAGLGMLGYSLMSSEQKEPDFEGGGGGGKARIGSHNHRVSVH